ncbi:sugar phosphate isomerase/epimerase family protein [Rhodococcus artemisiae]|uniref:Sugar phosphate isomerase/epimerase family protein n=1 Tax=Rhodococcus artemisiae TaxID=714159 RepID=A0ABU7LCE0_9NOCA|nr:sugar phosphate isomerase/epimerase family protein [Rhodococcus artemisiae]MEE2059185.1 sugar phosphate isomerase/epimerase family protein [Rhodococcus artemisiae]
MHEKISVSGLCFPAHDLTATLSQLDSIEARRTTLLAAKVSERGWNAGLERVRSSGVSVTALIESPFQLADERTWVGARSRMIDTLDAADALGASAVYMPTGPHISARWGECAAAFVEAAQPVLDHARRLGVRLAIEPTNWLYADLSFVHSVHDALALFELCDVGVCIDLFHVWTEAHFQENLEWAGERIVLVQVSDYILGDRSLPGRAVPGDGGIPITDLLASTLTAGYEGVFDIELSGPRVDAEGQAAAARRAMTWLDEAISKASIL